MRREQDEQEKEEKAIKIQHTSLKENKMTWITGI